VVYSRDGAAHARPSRLLIDHRRAQTDGWDGQFGLGSSFFFFYSRGFLGVEAYLTHAEVGIPTISREKNKTYRPNANVGPGLFFVHSFVHSFFLLTV
jgi:hypothetical protein